MRTLALVALGAALLAPPAQAHPVYHSLGSCGWLAVSDGGTDENTTWSGEVDLRVVATDANRVYAPVPTSVECRLTIAGQGTQTVLAASSPIGIAAGATTLSFKAHPDAFVYMCTVVTVAGETHLKGSGDVCGEGDPGLPQDVSETIDLVFATVDPVVCAALVAAAPGIPGVVSIEPGGDVYVAGEWIWDCAPYGT